MTCPFCKFDRVHDAKHYKDELPNWTLQCDYCGARKVNGKWEKRCQKCQTEVSELFGFFVPHLCRSCLKETAERDRKTGNVCLMCGSPRSLCCC